MMLTHAHTVAVHVHTSTHTLHVGSHEKNAHVRAILADKKNTFGDQIRPLAVWVGLMTQVKSSRL